MSRITLHDEDSLGRVWPANTVLRRQEKTNQKLYYWALQDAVRAAHRARRAIEFRLGLKMDQMHKDLDFVEAPSKWVNSLCSSHGSSVKELGKKNGKELGFDYEKISDPQGLAKDHYADAYIGEYVTKLQNVAKSYPEFPFPGFDWYLCLFFATARSRSVGHLLERGRQSQPALF